MSLRRQTSSGSDGMASPVTGSISGSSGWAGVVKNWDMEKEPSRVKEISPFFGS